MLCKKPYMIGLMPCACQRCLPCLINRRRLWTHRLLLESYKHTDSCFITLTYDADHIPVNNSLSIIHYQQWLKRLRKECEPEKIRFYLVGEYGDQSQRPHYHAALFGLNRFVAGGMDGRSGIVSKTWNFGFTYVGGLTRQSAQYIAGYVTKKMTSKDDPRLNGRFPEFARMSLRPGIGALAIEDLQKVLHSDVGLDAIAESGDVPRTLRHGPRIFPLGRYLRGKLRQALGLSSDIISQQNQKRYMEELRIVFQEDVKAPGNSSKSAGKIIVDKDAQKILNMETKFKIHHSVGVI